MFALSLLRNETGPQYRPFNHLESYIIPSSIQPDQDPDVQHSFSSLGKGLQKTGAGIDRRSPAKTPADSHHRG